MHFFSPLLIWWERVIEIVAQQIQNGWHLFLNSTPKADYSSSAYFSGSLLVCLSTLASDPALPPTASDRWNWGGGLTKRDVFWVRVTAVKHLSGSLPPLLFKSRHAFAHKDTRRHMGMCCETFSGDIRRGNAAAAGNQHTPTHTGAFRIFEDLPDSSVLSPGYLCMSSSWPGSFMPYSQEKVKL